MSSVVDSDASTPAVPEGWHVWRNPSAALLHSVPHAVVSQVLRPDIAAFMPFVTVQTKRDAQHCVTRVTIEVNASSDTLPQVAEYPLVTTLIGFHLEGDAACIGQLRGLRDLQLNSCKDLNASFFYHLQNLTELRSLKLWGCARISADSFKSISLLPELRELNLCGALGDVDGVVHLRALSQLWNLSLSGWKRLNAETLSHVAAVAGLAVLDLSGCPGVDAQGIAHLSKLRELEELNLSRCSGVDAQVLEQVSKIEGLEALTLWRCVGVDEAGLVHLSRLPRLRFLDVVECRHVTDQGLAHLPDLVDVRLY